jgi:DNA polymerase-3 subunit epsilon
LSSAAHQSHVQRYLNPRIRARRTQVTGLSLDFLSDKPKFAAVVDEFLEFIDGAELVIHNAAFDVGFLDNELRMLGPQYGRLADRCGIEDSLLLARQRFPGQRNSLDALCKRLGVDNRTGSCTRPARSQPLAEVCGLTPGRARWVWPRSRHRAWGRALAGVADGRARAVVSGREGRQGGAETEAKAGRAVWGSAAIAAAATSRRHGLLSAPVTAHQHHGDIVEPPPSASRRQGVHAPCAAVMAAVLWRSAVVDLLGEAVAAQQQLHALQFAGHGLDVEAGGSVTRALGDHVAVDGCAPVRGSAPLAITCT